MPNQLTTPIETTSRVEQQEVLDFRLTQTVPSGEKTVGLLMADLDANGAHVTPARQVARSIDLLEDDGTIHEPASLSTHLPASIKALQTAAGLTDQQLLGVAFAVTKAWSYAVFDDTGDLLAGSVV